MSVDIAVGIMDSAYFTSRSEILDFFNSLLDLNLKKIEETASGAVACQLTEYIFPNSIQMKKVNWECRNAYEYVQNYKLLQVAFTKNRVQKYVDVDKLIRGKYQDNLEFCQWLKAFYDQQYMLGIERDGYDPVTVRAKGKGGKNVQCRTSSSRPPSRAKQPNVSLKYKNPSSPQKTAKSPRVKQRSPQQPTTPRTSKNHNGPKERGTPNEKENSLDAVNNKVSSRKGFRSPEAIVADATLMKKNSDLISENTELKLTIIDVEKERNFYFDKLRDVEVLLQVHQEINHDASEKSEEAYELLIQSIFKVLYATAEDKITVDDDGKLVKNSDRASNSPLSPGDQQEGNKSENIYSEEKKQSSDIMEINFVCSPSTESTQDERPFSPS